MAYCGGWNMTLSSGYLTAKQKMMWDLKSSGLQEASIARKLGVTRQTVHAALDTANLKIGEALQEVAKINKIEVEIMDSNRGFLKDTAVTSKPKRLSPSQPKTASNSGTNTKATAKNAADSKPAEKPSSPKQKTATS